MAENVLRLEIDINLQIQEGKKTPHYTDKNPQDTS